MGSGSDWRVCGGKETIEAMRMKGGCLADALLESTGETPDSMAKVNEGVRRVRDRIYDQLDGWKAPA